MFCIQRDLVGKKTPWVGRRKEGNEVGEVTITQELRAIFEKSNCALVLLRGGKGGKFLQ